MNKVKIFSLTLVGVLLIYSCKDKTKDPEPTDNTNGKSKQELLSEKTWKVSSVVASGSEIWGLLSQPCDKDNTYKFKNNNVLTLFNTPLKCNVADPDSTNSAYKLIGDNKIYLNLRLSSSILIDDTTDINTLDASTLKLNIKYSGIDGVATFTH